MLDPDDRPQAFWGGKELEVTFTARAVKADYGVPGSPTWTEMEEIEIEEIEIEEIEILGVRVKRETLPGALLAKIHALSDELDW